VDELLAVTRGRPSDVIAPTPASYRFDLYPEHLKLNGQPSEQSLVYRPADAAAIARLLPWAAAKGLTVVPFGLGSNVVGAIDGRADIVVSFERMNAVLELDEVSQIVTAQAGISGGALEAAVQEHGFTVGHYPQSLHVSTIGGWVSTRATGTYSAHYGGIERSVCGATVVLADGEVLRIGPRVRAPGGLDLLSLLCGAEGSLGVLTEVSLAVYRRPDEQWICASFPALRDGLAAQRELSQAGFPIGLMRLFNKAETTALFDLDGSSGSVVLLLSTLGPAAVSQASAQAIRSLIPSLGGSLLADDAAESWLSARYRGAELMRDPNSQPGQMLDTIEASVPWANAIACAEELEEAFEDISVPYFLHFSHTYPSGVGLYMILHLSDATDADVLETWRQSWRLALAIVQRHAGAIGHHHGVGAARAELYANSADGLLHRKVKEALDPQGVLYSRLLGAQGEPATTGTL